ncbi:MAG: 4-(cytidine 5'-diphospho)-2-C-methyl-D-erythritol kinase [Oscillospiraceae bacterium]|nr:4-(cytidine 5'-diphospho)-2-C-methyl-D-erythritol kinase [Oscillospiraceae bacterium]
MKVQARAKINLSLDVLSKLEDGYHAVKLTLQSVRLCDELSLDFNGGAGVRVKTDLSYLPDDEGNIAAKAAKLFFSRAGIEAGCRIDIKKTIPVCAGLGGGSSDAAAVLRALNSRFGAGFSRAELEEMGKELGSDVPFCVSGGTALAEGKGERLTPLPPLLDCRIVVCKPAFSVSTPKLFAAIDCEKIRFRPDTDGLIAALAAGDLRGVAQRMYNVFEDVLGKRKGTVSDIKSVLLDNGALGACMSGTGSAVFGIFDDEAAAESARQALRSRYREVFLTEPCGAEETP